MVTSLRAYQYEKKAFDNERLDLFFRKNDFLNEFRKQTDTPAIYECYKAMILKQFEEGRTVFRYGTTGDECFFIIKGKIAMMQPTKEIITCNGEEDIIKFYAENFDEIIWEKVEDADEMKEMPLPHWQSMRSNHAMSEENG